ncbi:Flp pilus assembly protein CpaB [Pelotomaculum propionicicum]|uniref:SAF domain-containing protein n=1 Tax=Pelotomaculum propionicicum TaxID=258475 RepID=A0A4Y7RPK0_9FIRM|nr:Flp pilus assembly protein CpaB [Pelotomaculum propionicicum]NLI13853.1 Flp pilus assembly protein CpaB [Peptococcaceae bacterium]TEB10944.1 hypothetical protein Pmgp_01959 [Pelotomaculum propionicicum]
MKNKLLLILAIIIGLAAAAGIYLFLDNTRKTYQVNSDFVSVVVARQRIPAKTQITAQMVEMKDIPAISLNDLAVVDTKEVLGKTTKSEILPGEQVLRERLATERSSSEGLSFQIPQGKRAVSVAVDEVSGVAGLVKVGDRVDVLGTFDLQGATGQEKVSYTSILIQNVDVLSIDQSASPDALTSQDSKKASNSAHTITLSVTPEQAEPLVLCSEKGTIRLALRPAADQNVIYVPSIRGNQLIR